ncbi:ankyrin, partial [Glonium stellatum]
AAVRLLIERGANLNAKGRYGLTLLHIYAQRGNRIQVQLLLEYGANVNVRDNIGHTPLFLANYHGHEAVAELL